MPVMSGKATMAASASSGNVCSGMQYELAPFDGTIEIGAQSDRNSTTVTIFSGPDVLQQPGGIVNFSGTAGTLGFPKYPDDYHWEDEVAKGDRIAVIFTNGDGANAANVNWVIKLTPA